MSDLRERISKLSPKRLALLALELQARVEALEGGAALEPLAIVGMGCRFPGADSPAALWELLCRGGDAITEVPRDRWDVGACHDPDPDASGKMSTRYGGFLRDVDRFDAGFFGITPREAASMDPQQRLLLEVAWEALEDAGHAPDALSGSDTGVFVGLCNSDYSQRLLLGDPADLDAYVATGGAHSVAAGRLAYVLGLRGPNLAIDTACSSSLVAIHLAAQSLRAGECRMALAGGVNLILTPETTIMLSRARMMAPDGRCKAFDARADGFVRSEGCGIVVLKRLADAVADGDDVLAVLRGSAINQDGRSNGLTAPNGPAQEAVVRAALARAHVAPHEIAYVEAHGTGTALGDPIEMGALGAVLGPGRSHDRPLIVGSVKTNIGHLEAAAGVAGLMKVVLALRHRQIPRQLHFHTPNPHIGWDRWPVTIATRAVPWPAGRRLAGVSSFGFSGTNAHVVLEAAPDRSAAPEATGHVEHLLTLSARSEKALRVLAGRWAEQLADPTLPLRDLCATANAGRAQHEQRLAVAAPTAREASEALAAHAAGKDAPGIVLGRAPKPPGIVFLFPGQGTHYSGMGRKLYENNPVFRAALERCAAAARPALELPLLDVLYGSAADALQETAYTQVGLFSLEWALAEVWRGWGIEPSLVLGHSVGEYAAACVAGVLDVETAVALVAARGRLMGALPRGGAMASVQADEATVARVVAGSEVVLAAVNGPENVVISGETAALEAVVAKLAARGFHTQRLRVAHAFHSPLMEPMLGAFGSAAVTVRPAPPRIAMVSSVTGGLVGAGNLGAEYWVRQVREPVRYAAALAATRAAGGSLYVEVGPQPVLTGLGQAWLDGAIWAPTLRKGHDDRTMLLEALGRAWAAGVAVDWQRRSREQGGRRLAGLPTYPFERERHWLEPATGRTTGRGNDRLGHPLLGARVRSATAAACFESRLGPRAQPFLADHRIHGVLITPSPVYLEMALAAAADVLGCDVLLSDFTIEQPMVLSEEGALVVQTVVSPDPGGTATVEILSAEDPDAAKPTWRLHARAAARPADVSVPVHAKEPATEPGGETEIAGPAYHEFLRARGLDFGPAFQGIERVWRQRGTARGEIRVPEVLGTRGRASRLHPAVLDACLQVLGAAWPEEDRESYLLTGVERTHLATTTAQHLRAFASLRAPSPDGSVIGDVRVVEGEGRVVAAFEGIRLRRARPEAFLRARGSAASDGLYEVVWTPSPTAGASSASLLTSPRALADRLEAEVGPVAAAEGLARYDELLPALEELSYHYVLAALAALGWKPAPGEAVASKPLAAALAIEPRHQRLFGRLLEILAEEGTLRPAGAAGSWLVAGALPSPDPRSREQQLIARFPDAPELVLTIACGRTLADVLRGRTDPLQLLFSPSAFATTERLYTASPGARTYNGLIARAMHLALAPRAAGRPVRILEIGGGTGSTTAAVLRELPADSIDYVFTDISPAFTARAAETFDAPSLSCRPLDIERDPAEQGFGGERFDIVLAANVLHATRDLRRTLDHVGRLLAPQGLLFLLEGTARQRWVDLTFGLTEGWWRFGDADLRPAHPLLTAPRWLELLESSGFAEVSAIPGGANGGALSTQTILLARRAAASATADRAHTSETRAWLLLSDRRGVGPRVAAILEASGARVRLVSPSDPEPAGTVRRALSAGPWCGVIDLRALDCGAERTEGSGLPDAVARGCAEVVDLAQAVGAAAGATPTRLWLVTRGAQAVGTADTGLIAIAQAALWGLGRVIAIEDPDHWGGLIDLDPAASDVRSAEQIVAQIQLDDGEDQVAFRADERHVPRLSPSTARASESVVVRPDGAYLVTGGLGGLGLKVARWLAEQGAREIVLVGRRGLPPRAEWASLPPDSEPGRQATAVAAVESTGARVRIVAADVTDRAAMASLLTTFGGDAPALRGIVHAAAELRADTLAEMNPEALAAVLGPKVAGAWLLHEMSRGHDLDFFVLFSSTTALLGARRLGHYAAANHFLDALAHRRRHEGRPALSVNWGTWDEMRATSEGDRRGFVQTGLLPMRAEDALAALAHLLPDVRAQVTVAAVDWGALTAVYAARRRRPFLERLATIADAPKRPRLAAAAAGDLMARVRAAPPESRGDLLLAFVREQVGAVMRIDPARVDVEQGLFDMGLDSLMALDVKTRLEGAVNRRLPSTLTFNYPTVTALAGYLACDVLGSGSPEPVASVVPAPDAATPPAVSPDDASSDEASEEELASRLARKLEQMR